MNQLRGRTKDSCWAVVPAGGSGTRFSGQDDKLMATIDGIPVIVRTVARLLEVDCIESVIIAVRPHCYTVYHQALEGYGFEKPVQWVEGGETRRESVYKALKALPDEVTLVVIHDAARPLVNTRQVEEAIQSVCSGATGSFLAVPVQDTLKEVDPASNRVRTVDRQHVWRAQTPQVFKKEVILRAHEAALPGVSVTDDIQLVEWLEMDQKPGIQLIEGSESNLKITTQEDCIRAEGWLKAIESLKL